MEMEKETKIVDTNVVVEKEATVLVGKDSPPAPEQVPEKKVKKIEEFVSFKEESNKVEDLVDPEKKALDELKLLIQDALNSRQFFPPANPSPPPPSKVEEEKEDPKVEEEKEDRKVEEKKEEPIDEEKNQEPEAEPTKAPHALIAEEEKIEENPADPEAKSEEKMSETVEKIKETMVQEVTTPAAPPPEDPVAVSAEEVKPVVSETPLPLPPEEVSIWGVPLLTDDKTDVILLKFLRARDFKVKEAFSMLKNVVTWRKDFKIDELLEEEFIIEGLEKAVYLHGFDREGHPVSYNAFGEFQDKVLYSNTFDDAEKRAKFLKWYIQFLEKNIRKLDFTPGGVCTIVQIIDLKNSPGLMLFKKELRQATNQALQLLQDNYPEFVAKQIFINVPWWYLAYNRLISPFLTMRTKSKFVFAGPTRTSETLIKYIAPEQLPVQYGGLDKIKGDQEFSSADPATEEIIKPTSKHTIEFPITEVGVGTLVWEVRVIGWDVSYGVEFEPSAEGSYTWIVQKPRKIASNEQIIESSFNITETGKFVLIFDNQSSRKKKVLYRFKTTKSA